jgi:hypothetical protein
MKNSTLPALLASTLFTFGCGGSGNATAGDAGPHSDAPTDAGSHADREASQESGTSVLATDPLSTVSGSSHEHEPFIAVSPGGRVGVSFLSYLSGNAGITVGYRISNDRGDTWGPATLFPIPSGDNTQANASIAAGDDGTLYMSWAAETHTATGRSNQHVFVAKSAPGSTSFDAPVIVSDPAVAVSVYDQPRVMVTHAGVVNVGYLAASPDGVTSWLVNARSTDGKTWKRSFAAGPGSEDSFRNEARFCRPSGEGRIFLVYLDSDVAYYQGDLGLGLRYSDDDGATWSAPVVVSTESDELIIDASANLGCVTSGTDVWIDYGLTPIGNLGGSVGGGSPDLEHTMTRVRLAHSSDAGKTIDTHADVLDAQAAPRAMYPVLTGEGQKTLDLSYYGGTFDGDPKAVLMRTRATDGKTFLPPTRVHSPLTLETNRADPRWIGDYVGAAFQGGDLFLVFTDNATATPHVGFYRSTPELPSGAGLPDASTPPSDGGDAGVCYPGTKFTPVQWAPPSAFGQGVCSATQLTAYLACTEAGDCTAFRADGSNSACLGCLETDESAATHGPFITQAGDAGVSLVEVNYGGCQAHYDGKTAAGSCGEQYNDFNDCVDFECQGCSDFSSPSQGGPTYDCYYTAIDDGVCSTHRETTECGYETFEGGVAVSCTDPTAFLPLWCGGG